MSNKRSHSIHEDNGNKLYADFKVKADKLYADVKVKTQKMYADVKDNGRNNVSK